MLKFDKKSILPDALTKEEPTHIKINGKDVAKIAMNKRILPEGYNMVEYLESTGTQYINTNIRTFYKSHINLGFQITNYDDSTKTICGMFNTVRLYIGAIRQFNVTSRYNATWLYYENPPIIGKDYNVEWDYDGKQCTMSCNNIVNTSKESLSSTNDIPIYLFALNEKSTASQHSYARIKYFKMNTSISSIDLIPAIDPNGRPCMYDLVTQQPFYNSGTGEFLTGPVVPQREIVWTQTSTANLLVDEE